MNINRARGPNSRSTQCGQMRRSAVWLYLGGRRDARFEGQEASRDRAVGSAARRADVPDEGLASVRGKRVIRRSSVTSTPRARRSGRASGTSERKGYSRALDLSRHSPLRGQGYTLRCAEAGRGVAEGRGAGDHPGARMARSSGANSAEFASHHAPEFRVGSNYARAHCQMRPAPMRACPYDRHRQGRSLQILSLFAPPEPRRNRRPWHQHARSRPIDDGDRRHG